MHAALCASARRGVATTIVFPARNDSWIVGAASRSDVTEFLEAGERIHEYVGGRVHTESLTTDGEVTLIGSASADRRSFELNDENNVLLVDRAVTAQMPARQDAYIASSREASLQEVDTRPLGRRLWSHTVAILGPVLRARGVPRPGTRIVPDGPPRRPIRLGKAPVATKEREDGHLPESRIHPDARIGFPPTHRATNRGIGTGDVAYERPPLGSICPPAVPDSCRVKVSDVIEIPRSLNADWREAIHAELNAAEEELPRLSKAAFELAALVVSGEYDAEVIGEILDNDEELSQQVLALANSSLYAAVTTVESATVAAQRIGMRALFDLAVIKVARTKIFGPVLKEMLGGKKAWEVACNAGVISHRISATKLGSSRASLLGGLILSSGPPLGFQLIQRVEARLDKRLSQRMRSELIRRVGPALCVLLVGNWPLPASILSAAKSIANWPHETPPAPDVQVAIFSAYLGRLISATGFDNLSIPAAWPVAKALNVDREQVKQLANLVGSGGFTLFAA
jgi:HD-like signal output (HDOD) protein